jgi:hypothetical protein
MPKDNKRRLTPFLDVPEWWEKDWQDMPEFVQEDQSSYKAIIVHFENKQDMKTFAKLIGQKIGFKTKSIWYPKIEREQLINKLYIDKKDES